VLRYDDFLDSIDRRLLAALRPFDVLRFWRSASGMKGGEPWLAVFGIDGVRQSVLSLAGHPYSGASQRSGVCARFSQGAQSRCMGSASLIAMQSAVSRELVSLQVICG